MNISYPLAILATALFAAACGGHGTTGTTSGAGGSTSAPGKPGDACSADAACASGVCLNGRCAAPCTALSDCLPGPEWTCALVPGKARVCQCAPTGAEVCDGRDNDCNGVVDDGAMCPGGGSCVSGACACPPGHTCGGACVDIATDPKHCGDCNTICPTTATCSGGQCHCPSMLAPCGTECVDLTSNPSHCGNCATVCALGQPCMNSMCACTGTVCGGACVDTATSNTNCGTCNHACLGAACSASVCQPIPVVTSNYQGNGVAVDGTTAYFIDFGGTILKAPLLATSPVTQVGQSPASETGTSRLIEYGSNLYWYAVGNVGSTYDLLTVPKAGGTPTVLLPKVVTYDLALDGGYLYYSSTPGIERYEVATGMVTLIVPGSPGGIAIDATHIYFSDGAGIERVLKDGTGGVQLIVPGAAALSVAVDGTYVYWDNAGGTGIFRRTKDGSGMSDTLSLTADSVTQIVADASGVYWSAGNELGWAKAGSTSGTALLTGNAFDAIALSPSAIYWASLDMTKALGFEARP